MCDGHLPPFTLRFGDLKRVRHQKRGVPEPPHILLVMDFSNYVSGDEFCDPDFDADLMLNQIQLMSLHCQESLLLSTVETSCTTLALEPSWFGTSYQSICFGPGHECFFGSSLAWSKNGLALL